MSGLSPSDTHTTTFQPKVKKPLRRGFVFWFLWGRFLYFVHPLRGESDLAIHRVVTALLVFVVCVWVVGCGGLLGAVGCVAFVCRSECKTAPVGAE